jgi:hypothetical protein
MLSKCHLVCIISQLWIKVNSVGHHYPQANTNNVNKTRALLQTTGGKDEANIVCMRKSQHGTQNVKTHNRRTQGQFNSYIDLIYPDLDVNVLMM